MASLNEKIRIEIDLPGAGTYQVSKVWGNSLSVAIQKHGDSRTKRAIVTSDIVFREGDYTTLLAIEQGSDRCEKIPIRFYNRRNGNLLPISGYIAMNKATVNIQTCEIRARVTADDTVTCFDENKNKELNFLQTPNAVSASGVVGTIQTLQTGFVDCQFLPPTIPVDVIDFILQQSAGMGQPGWIPRIVEGRNIVQNSFPTQWDGEFRITFIRETIVSATTPPGIGWVNTGGNNWVREPRVQQVINEQTNLVFTGGNYYDHYIILAETPIDNGRRLSDVLDFLAPCGLPIASDFFNINPPGTAPANSAYTAAATQMADVLVFQKSDVTRPNVSNNATIQKTTILKFLGYLRDICQVDWAIEIIGGVPTLRIEHETYFDNNTVGLDLTVAQYERWLLGRENYTYKTDNLAGTERFYWMDTVSANFEASNITYGGGCTNLDEVKDYRTEVTTDLAFAQAQPEKVSDQGFFFMACQPFGTDHIIIEAAIPLLSGTHFNAPFSYRSLHFNYWRYGRNAGSGEMNGSAATFLSTVKIKQQEQIRVPRFCLEQFETWNFSGLVRTNFGDGSHDSVYDLANESLTINPIF